MKSRLESTVTALVAGLAGLVWLTAAQAVDLQWFGHAAFKITSDNGKVIVIDPFIIKNPKTPENLKDLSKIGKVDLILVTHGHGDHMRDVGALAKMTGAKVALMCRPDPRKSPLRVGVFTYACPLRRLGTFPVAGGTREIR